MKNKNIKWLTWICWLVSILFVVTVVLPLCVERFTIADRWKSQFFSFQLTDENGQRHVGFFSLAKILYDAEFMEYGYEAPKGQDLSKWVQPIIGLPRNKVSEQDGFIWADKGFLWSDYKTLNEVTLSEGKRLGLPYAPKPNQQLEISVPGAALDIASPTTSYLGRFPNYAINYEDKNFK
ncbi:MAG TPA: hypothetical protein VFM46_05350, partial [Pseudomonadales bacterium]|nr:hypothetical protein [Pseudomonadales bacterium]